GLDPGGLLLLSVPLSACGAALGTTLSYRARSRLEKDLDGVCHMIGPDARVEIRSKPALRSGVAWLAAHPELGPDQRSALMALLRGASDRAEFFQAYERHIEAGAIRPDNAGQVLRFVVRNGVLNDKLSDLLTRALDPLQGGSGVQEKAGRIVVGGIPLKRRGTGYRAED
ncbi:MAG: hypothetical protein AB1758_37470, partial [Candidatus Eremiobacterota bacterium]